jgi:hypothetical protein
MFGYNALSWRNLGEGDVPDGAVGAPQLRRLPSVRGLRLSIDACQCFPLV